MIIALTDSRTRHIVAHGDLVTAVYATPTDADVTLCSTGPPARTP
jgi:hypothetical protein